MNRNILCFIGLISSLFAKNPMAKNQMDWALYQQKALQHQESIPGWCSKEKATDMLNLILEEHPKVCVEVGVFGGSSIYPTASALKYLGEGTVYAIDPWATDKCLEGYTPGDPNHTWWGEIDLEKIYVGFLEMLNSFDLNAYCIPMRTTGRIALKQFPNESIDILHIDGNHTEDVALADAKMYLPKVKSGGYIWFDDVNWPTTKNAWEYLSLHCDKIESRSTNLHHLYRKR